MDFSYYPKNVFSYASYQTAVPKGLRDGDCAVTEFMCQVSSSTFDTEAELFSGLVKPGPQTRGVTIPGNTQKVCGCGSWGHRAVVGLT